LRVKERKAGNGGRELRRQGESSLSISPSRRLPACRQAGSFYGDQE